MASKVSGMIEKIKIGTTSRAIASTAYGYCETAAATQIKDVDMTGFVLYEGVTVHIKFANANSADNPKLRINSTVAADAKPIVQYGTTAAGKTSETNGWYAGAVISFTYDGTSWVRDQGYNSNTTYTFTNGTNGFTVTPSSGTAQTVTVTPSITNNITGTGTANYLTKFTGTNTIGNSGLTTDTNNNLTIPGTIYFSSNTSTSTGKALFAYNSTYPKYGIWYKEGEPDVMAFSASGNGDSTTNADFAVQGGGKLYNKGNIIPNTGNNTGSVGGTTTPVYIDAGVIKAGTALGTASTHADTDFALSGHDHNSVYLTVVGYDSTNKKIYYTKNGSNTDVVTFGSNAFNSTSYLPLSGGNMSGKINTSYKSSTWVKSLTSSAITLEDATGSFGGWICGPTKNGRIAIATYQNSDDKLYFGYGERDRTANSYAKSMTWDGATGTLSTTAFSGSGASLTSLNASNISSGTLSADRLATSGATAGSYGPSANVTGSNNATMSVPYITVDNKGRVTSISNKTYTAVNTWRSISDSLEGTSSTVSASEKAVGLLNTKVNGLLAAADAMIFKGTLGTGGTITAVPDGTSGKEYQAGYTYKVITAGTYADIVCEIGDLLIAISDSVSGQTAVNDAHWTVAQTNIDGAVTGPASVTATGNIAIFDGTTGKIIKDSGVTLAQASVASAATISTTGGSTANFWRGDNSWSNVLGATALNNTAFINTLTLFNNQSNESGTSSFDAAKSSWGIGFKRQWSSGTTGAVHAGVYAYGISNWRAGLVFRVKSGTTAASTHDTTALYLNYDGSAVFAKTVTATGFSGPLTGDVTGNLTGDVTGNVTGNVSGSSGSCTGNATTATTATNLSAAPTITAAGTATINLSANTTYTLTVGGKSVIFKTPADNNTNTATAADNILDGSNSGTEITYKPYTTQQTKLSFDTSTTNPTRTDRLNLNGYLYATKLYSGGTEVSVSGHTHNYAGSASAGGPANTVKGAYTSNGGKQNPNYFGVNKVGFLMMNTTVNNNSQYKDWIIMDCYSGNDVGGGVALGVNRQSLGAYIMRSAAARDAWAESAELLGTHNYTSYTVKKDGTGASGTWGISITGNASTASSIAWSGITGAPENVTRTQDGFMSKEDKIKLDDMEVIKGTQTGKTGSWTGTSSVITSLYDGLTIKYYLNRDPSGNASLNLTLADGSTTGAIPCYYNSGRLTTHYAVGSVITLTYFNAGSITVNGTATTDNRWIADANYDSGNTNTATRQKTRSTDANYSLLFADPVVGTADNNTAYYTYRNDNIYANPSSGTIYATNFNGSLTGNCSGSSGSCTGNAATASNLLQNTRMDYGWSGINYFNISAANQNAVKVNDTPFASATWTHILRFNHANSSGYYTDLAIPFNANGIYYKRIGAGVLQNSGTTTKAGGGWVAVLDELNTSAANSNGSDISVSWNTSTKIATINGVDVKIKIPSNPNTNTTYTFANGTTGSFTVTPSGGSAQTVSIGKPSTAGTADKATAANIANGTTANAIAYYTNTTGTFGTKATSSGALYATSNNGALTFGVLPIAQGGIGSATTSPNYVLAGPSSGSATGAPSWRKLVAADIPNLNTSKLNAGTLGVARGGTGKDTWAAYSLPYASAANTLGELAANTTTTRKFLMMQGNGSAVESFGWNTVTKTDVGLSNVTNDAQVKASLGSAIGDMVYWSAASTPARLAIGTVGQILKVVKNSSNQLVPQWGAAPETYPSGGSAGQCLAKTSSGVGWSDGTKKTADTSTLYYVCGSSSDSTNYNGLIFNTNVYVSSNVLFGAAWNDYAEYRECTQVIEPGRCIVENGDGTLSLSTQRLQGGAEIVSDTFGFAIGKTAKCKTPIAVSGRVLAYINEPIEQIKIGSPVCSGPNGTVSQMTSFEARKYPWLIIGTISAIPQEEFWGEAKVSTKNRIWIRIR